MTTVTAAAAAMEVAMEAAAMEVAAAVTPAAAMGGGYSLAREDCAGRAARGVA